MKSGDNRELVVLPGLDAEDHELSRAARPPADKAIAGTNTARELAAAKRALARARAERDALRARLERREAKRLAAAGVAAAASAARARLGIDDSMWAAMTSRPLRRSRELIAARAAFVAAMRSGETPASYTEIAATMGLTSHSSVIGWHRLSTLGERAAEVTYS